MSVLLHFPHLGANVKKNPKPLRKPATPSPLLLARTLVVFPTPPARRAPPSAFRLLGRAW